MESNELTQNLRKLLLSALNGVYPWPLDSRTIKFGMRPPFHTLSVEEIDAELSYLAGRGKEYVERVEDDLAPAVNQWKLSPKGKDYLAKNALD